MKSFKHGASRLGCALLATAALTVLSACGGGTAQIEPFAPTRIIVFGDESSAITSEGKKYTVNALDATTGALACASNPNWVQKLAEVYTGLVFPQCNPGNVAVTTGIMYATAGAKVADVKTKIDTHFATNSFGPKDMVTMLVGANDVFELYSQFPAQSQDSLLAEARARGTALGQQVNRIANANGRIILSTLPDLGTTPFAVEAEKLNAGRAAFLSKLSDEFNVAMRLAIINDGRLIGLVLLDENSKAFALYPSYYGFANAVAPVCLTTVATQDCTTKTLVTDGSGDTWLWATDRLLSAGGQLALGNLAIARLTNPF